MSSKKGRKRNGDEETNYWLSYSDMMAALLLVFVLIISFTMLQSKRQYEEKEAKLQEQQSKLDGIQMELDDLKEMSLERESEVKVKDKLIAEQQEKLDSFANWESERLVIEDENKKLETEVEKLEVKLEEKETIVKEQEKLLIAYKETLAEQEATVEAQQEKLDKLIGIRSELVETLKKEFENSSLNVIVDEQTGAITFDSGILFDFAQSELKPSGKEFLDEFLPRYISILQGSEYEPYIAEIIIEGHTDSIGSYLSNLSLSQNRALAVARYCLADNGVILERGSIDKLRKIVTANGRSFSNLIYNEDGTENADASRRVEFKFRLKDEEMIQEMRSILEN